MSTINAKKIRSIHFVGIKGVGMAPLAILAKEAGMVVTGSDVADEFITDAALQKAGITPFVGFSKDHVTDASLIVTTGAHGGFDNEEVIAAKALGISVWTQGRAVGEFMKGRFFGRTQKGISITGTHGKTTTTAMVATILAHAGIDPSFVIGTSDIPSLGTSGHYGKGEYFVAEADEYVSEPTHEKIPKLLQQEPEIAVITNIEYDHPDVYASEAEVIDTMFTFVNEKVQPNGIVILNCDDENSKRLRGRLHPGSKKILTFGKDEGCKYRIHTIQISAEKTTFELDMPAQGLVEFILHTGGEHNVYNAAGAIIASIQCGLSVAKLQEGIAAFKGSKRRLEYIGTLRSGALLYDDYAHHPTEIAKTLEALRKIYKNKHIVCIFQPHTYSRTKALFDKFAQAFGMADEVIFADIYASLREYPDSGVSSKLLCEKTAIFHKHALYLPKPIDVVKYLNEKKPGSDTIVVIMGAGDIYKIKEFLIPNF